MAIFRERTMCENAALVDRVRARALGVPPLRRARGPRRRAALFRCAVPARLAAGDEIVLDRIEMEVPNV